MGSYVVKTDDICGVIKQMEEFKGSGTLEYKPDLLNHLKEDEYRRIKWFFYCDDEQGNTIRVFDRQFLEKFRSLIGRNTHVLLRGKKLGELESLLRVITNKKPSSELSIRVIWLDLDSQDLVGDAKQTFTRILQEMSVRTC